MPGIVVFRRRWSVGSDDLVVPAVFLLVLHAAWIIILGIILGVVDFERKVACTQDLHDHVLGYLIILSVCFFMELLIAIISMRGGILDNHPRRSMQYLLYLRLIVFLGELAWLVVGIVWTAKHFNTCNPISAKKAVLGVIVCNWLVMLIVIVSLWCTFDSAGRKWVKMKKYQDSLKEKRRGNRRISGSTRRNWRQRSRLIKEFFHQKFRRKAFRAYEESWDRRLQLLCCCVERKGRNRNSIAEIAQLFTEFFRDLDVVPSDVIAGLVLLRQFQKQRMANIVWQGNNDVYQYLSGVPITPHTQFLQLSVPSVMEDYRRVIHYMRHALAAYGWPATMMINPGTWLCRLMPFLTCCCCNKQRNAIVIDDNCCLCNFSALRRISGLQEVDVVYATYHVDIGETPFYVALDHAEKTVVVCVRGTLSLQDVLTDLKAEAETLPLTPPREDWQGHKGMVQAAVYIKKRLDEEGIIIKAMNLAEELSSEKYDLTLVGHSLGAGTAAILAILLQPEFPTLHCYAFSPPGGLIRSVHSLHHTNTPPPCTATPSLPRGDLSGQSTHSITQTHPHPALLRLLSPGGTYQVSPLTASHKHTPTLHCYAFSPPGGLIRSVHSQHHTNTPPPCTATPSLPRGDLSGQSTHSITQTHPHPALLRLLSPGGTHQVSPLTASHKHTPTLHCYAFSPPGGLIRSVHSQHHTNTPPPCTATPSLPQGDLSGQSTHSITQTHPHPALLRLLSPGGTYQVSPLTASHKHPHPALLRLLSPRGTYQVSPLTASHKHPHPALLRLLSPRGTYQVSPLTASHKHPHPALLRLLSPRGTYQVSPLTASHKHPHPALLRLLSPRGTYQVSPLTASHKHPHPALLRLLSPRGTYQVSPLTASHKHPHPALLRLLSPRGTYQVSPLTASHKHTPPCTATPSLRRGDLSGQSTHSITQTPPPCTATPSLPQGDLSGQSTHSITQTPPPCTATPSLPQGDLSGQSTHSITQTPPPCTATPSLPQGDLSGQSTHSITQTHPHPALLRLLSPRGTYQVSPLPASHKHTPTLHCYAFSPPGGLIRSVHSQHHTNTPPPCTATPSLPQGDLSGQSTHSITQTHPHPALLRLLSPRGTYQVSPLTVSHKHTPTLHCYAFSPPGGLIRSVHSQHHTNTPPPCTATPSLPRGDSSGQSTHSITQTHPHPALLRLLSPRGTYQVSPLTASHKHTPTLHCYAFSPPGGLIRSVHSLHHTNTPPPCTATPSLPQGDLSGQSTHSITQTHPHPALLRLLSPRGTYQVSPLTASHQHTLTLHCYAFSPPGGLIRSVHSLHHTNTPPPCTATPSLPQGDLSGQSTHSITQTPPHPALLRLLSPGGTYQVSPLTASHKHTPTLHCYAFSPPGGLIRSVHSQHHTNTPPPCTATPSLPRGTYQDSLSTHSITQTHPHPALLRLLSPGGTHQVSPLTASHKHTPTLHCYAFSPPGGLIRSVHSQHHTNTPPPCTATPSLPRGDLSGQSTHSITQTHPHPALLRLLSPRGTYQVSPLTASHKHTPTLHCYAFSPQGDLSGQSVHSQHHTNTPPPCTATPSLPRGDSSGQSTHSITQTHPHPALLRLLSPGRTHQVSPLTASHKHPPTLHCYTFSPPGGLISISCVEETKSYITSVVVGKDVVPRIGLPQMELLRTDIINMIKKSNDPKWQIISKGVFCCCGDYTGKKGSQVDLDRNVTAHPSDSQIGLSAHVPLFPPGKIIHIVRSHPKESGPVCQSSEPVYQAVWAGNGDFDEVLISPTMINDHMPDNVLEALEKVLLKVGPAKPVRTLTEAERKALLSHESLSSANNPSPTRGTVMVETSFTNACYTAPDPGNGALNVSGPRSVSGSWENVPEKILTVEHIQQLNAVGRNPDSGTRPEFSLDLAEKQWVAAPLASPEALSDVSSLGGLSHTGSLVERDGSRKPVQSSPQLKTIEQSPLRKVRSESVKIEVPNDNDEEVKVVVENNAKRKKVEFEDEKVAKQTANKQAVDKESADKVDADQEEIVIQNGPKGVRQVERSENPGVDSNSVTVTDPSGQSVKVSYKNTNGHSAVYNRHSPDESTQHEYGHPNLHYSAAGTGYPHGAYHPPIRFPAVRPREKIVSPREKTNTPCEQTVTPREQTVTPREQTVTPREQSVTACEQTVTPREQTVTPHEQTVTPREQTVTPSEQNVTPREKKVTSFEQTVTPREHPPTLRHCESESLFLQPSLSKMRRSTEMMDLAHIQDDAEVFVENIETGAKKPRARLPGLHGTPQASTASMTLDNVPESRLSSTHSDEVFASQESEA
ncbi:uncharacterized protein LOC124138229 isoform X2 [Haliotis rufescens]|uniref:uncharacterized protein LOC124138229 isoform X2 n=1 Tax=Haliotis rufescens TaxID=6454 RepID=UPI00201F4B70|nr:uncharacterized protein LOC124138229 isoform X2 [Haliotis rufescens]